MNYENLGATDLIVSRAGLGTVEIGLPYGIGLPNPPTDDECVALLHTALDHGITYFDTAHGYGRSEELLGKAFGGMGSARPTIATKVRLKSSVEKPVLQGDELVRTMTTSIDESRNRLQLDCLDLVQVYIEEPAFKETNVLSSLLQTMEQLSKSGRVRWWGASTYGVNDALEVIRQEASFHTLQVAYNLLDRTLEKNVLPACRKTGIGIVLRSVFLQGVLSHRTESYPKRMAELKQTALQARAICESHNLSLPECALRFASFGPAQPDVTLFGTFSESELAENIAAIEAGPLPTALSDELTPLAMDGSELLFPSNWKLPHAFTR